MYKTIIENIDGDRYFFHRIIKSMFETETPKYFYLNRTLTIFSESEPKNPYKENVDINSIEQINFSLNGIKIFTIDVCPEKRSIKTKKKYLVEKENVPSWFSEKMKSIGANVIEQNIVNKRVDKFYQSKNNNQIVKKYYTIVGIIDIENEELFNKTYTNGIGSGKTWGFGLLNLI